MTHYRLTDSTPSAIILARNPRTSSLDELKTYQGNDIFLNNGDEFQIRLFNPLSEKIGVQVSINGKIPNRLFVLNPGEVVDIDRFIDEQRRMIFETYQYDNNNAAAKSAVASNGIIDLKFFKEYFPPVYPTWNTTTTTTGFGISGGCFTTTSGVFGSVTPTSFNLTNSNSRTYDSNVFLCSVQSLDFVSDNFESQVVSAGVPAVEKDLSQISSSRKLSKSISRKETGRVSKGGKSSQDFKNVDVQFEVYPFHTIVYYLKPMSEKNSYIKEVREYCTSCKYRVRNDKWQFCPRCGEKL